MSSLELERTKGRFEVIVEAIDILYQLQDDLDWKFVSPKFKITCRKWSTHLDTLRKDACRGPCPSAAPPPPTHTHTHFAHES